MADIWMKMVAKVVIASKAKQSMAPHEEWIASSQGLLAMTGVAQHARSAGPSPTISGCRASETAGDIRITSAWAAKIAAAR